MIYVEGEVGKVSAVAVGKGVVWREGYLGMLLLWVGRSLMRTGTYLTYPPQPYTS